MELFAKVLQGPYAYLLILQVLIVSGLCLTLIYLILLRLREMPAAMHAATPVPVPAHAPEAEAPAPATNGTLSIIARAAETANARMEVVPDAPPSAAVIEAMPAMLDTPSIPDPSAMPLDPSPAMSAPAPSAPVDSASLQAERERAAALEQEAAISKDKVRYLESKLLEYEILQEEIGTLSSLKVENEKLRQELMTAKQGGAPAAAPATPAAEEKIDVASTPESKASADAAVDLLTGTELPTPAIDADPGTEVNKTPAMESQLDSLLGQIDTLTKKE